MIAIDLSNSIFISAKLDGVNFSESNGSGMNFANFSLDKTNFINSLMCDTYVPWSKKKIECIK